MQFRVPTTKLRKLSSLIFFSPIIFQFITIQLENKRVKKKINRRYQKVVDVRPSLRDSHSSLSIFAYFFSVLKLLSYSLVCALSGVFFLGIIKIAPIKHKTAVKIAIFN